MQEPKKIILASSLEPSGLTWLINCFLHLGYMCYPAKNRNNVWSYNSARTDFILSHEFDYLKKWLPTLRAKQSFNFQAGVEFEWTHSWISPEDLEHKSVLMVRDPRSSLYSRFARDETGLQFDQYLKILDQRTLLPKHQFLDLFYNSWLNHPKLSIVKFEDYKINAARTLTKVLKEIGLSENSFRIENACLNSTFEKAADSETQYLAENLDSTGRQTRINRSGSVDEWRNGNFVKTNDSILQFCDISMNKLGYKHSQSPIRNEIVTMKSIFYKDKIVDFTGLYLGFSSTHRSQFYSFKSITILGFNRKIYSKRDSIIFFYNLIKFMPIKSIKLYYFILLSLSIFLYLMMRFFNFLKIKIFM